MLFATVMLSQLLAHCAPQVGARTMGAIVSVESGGDPLAIHDNTDRRSLHAPTARVAASWASYFIARGHSVDLGIAQINNANLPRLGMSVDQAFDACDNLHGAATILSYDYGHATQVFGPGQYALRHALAAYNTGSLFAGRAYVEKILAAAGIDPRDDSRVPDLDGGAPIATALQPQPIVTTRIIREIRYLPAPGPAAPTPTPPQSSNILIPVVHAVFATPAPQASPSNDDDSPVILHWSRDGAPPDKPAAPPVAAAGAIPSPAPRP
jgi:type IV secretion system protein VirB1